MRAFEPILQVLKEWITIDGDAGVEGQAEILGEGALAGSVEARYPDTDLVLATRIHGGLHLEQQFVELFVDAVGDDVLGDFLLEPLLLGNAIGDDLFDTAVDIFAGVEECFDFHGIT